jgi:hypothetical protein
MTGWKAYATLKCTSPLFYKRVFEHQDEEKRCQSTVTGLRPFSTAKRA